ncbi:MAG: prephenate dehydrogenase/arogenate dehydrogenase family protein [Candidatus Dormibacteria bacterium]
MDRVAIVGLGLIGGSIGLALKRYRPGIEVLGVARRPETARQALERGAADRAGIDLSLVAEADLVFLACPLGVTNAVLEECAPLLAKGARVTDVGSVKSGVVAHAARVLSSPRTTFLGGHPMAGKEVTGIEHADADLFRGRPWVFTPESGWFPEVGPALASERAGSAGGYEPQAWQDVLQLVRDLGALPLIIPPSRHDRYVALVSHVPFLLSAAYLLATGEDDAWPDAAGLASSGFRDISRLGGGDPQMYAAIASMNRDEVMHALAGVRAALEQVEAAVTVQDGAALLELLTRARATRQAWAAAHPGLA